MTERSFPAGFFRESGACERHRGKGRILIGRERGKRHSSGRKELGSKGKGAW